MIFFIIIPIIVFIVSLFHERHERVSKIARTAFGLTMGAIAGGMFGFVLNVFGFIYKDNIDYPTKEYWHVNIVSLRNDERIQGNFVIGNGSIGSKSVYYTYIKKDQDSYRQFYVDTDYTIIQETDDVQPQLIAYGRDVSQHSLFWSVVKPDERVTNYLFKVPKGTIIKEFKVN